MRTVAAETATGELTVLGVSFGRVATGAGDGCRRAGVRLMALQALGMAHRRTLGLLGVAAFARCSARAAVRFVAVGACGVPGDYGVLFGCMARGTAGLGRGMMWQAVVATAAVLVALAFGDGADLFGMAAIAQIPVGFGQRELMRLVTLRASHRPMKVLIAVRGFVAAAAGERHFTGVTGGRVGVVTANAAARGVELRVVGMHALMAVDARFFWAALHVMGSVAAHASSVRRHGGGGHRVNFGVARAARQRRLLAELVRLVTADALGVAIGKERRLGHDRLLAGVA